MHTMFMVIRDEGKRLTQCPTDNLDKKTSGSQQPARVLDLGCGTGIWMLAMAAKHPEAHFVGVDLCHMGPNTVYPNVIYTAPWDYDGPWALGEKSWDLIHLQMGLGSVFNWGKLFDNIMDHLVPGTGWFEWVELDYEPRVDGKPLSHGRLAEWWHTYIKPNYERVGRKIHWDPNVVPILEARGFKDVNIVPKRIPLNEWNTEIASARAAAWWQVSMGNAHHDSSGKGLEAISMAILCHVNNWQEDHVRRLCHEAMQQASDPNLHVYNTLYVLTARAPEESERRPRQR
jgi:SAM-dependent methyltransferase